MKSTIKSAEFSAMDYSITAIEYAHDHYEDIDFCVGDAYDPPYSTSYFDIIVCNNLYEHVPDPLRLLGKIRRILKPGGYIIMSTPSRYRLVNLIKVIIGQPVNINKHHVTEYSVGQVMEQLAYCGFEIEMILSRPIFKGYLQTIVRTVLQLWIKMMGSHHQLGSTVFYLAKKCPENVAERDT
jgi:SAM-dependent methyltransferase